MNQTHPRVDAYLQRLDTLLEGAPPATRTEVVAGVREHLHDSLPADADDEQVRSALAGLGTPEQIADEAYAVGPGSRAGAATLAQDRRWLPVVVMVLGFLVLLLLTFFAVTGPHPVELLFALFYPPLWPVLAVLVVIARGWTTREKVVLIGVFPAACALVAIVAAVAWSVNEAVGAAASVTALLLSVVVAATVVVVLGRRGLRRAR